MPLYEYECRKCGRRFERIQKFSDSPLKKCEECGGAIERLISASAIQFKGTGWYVTDYARKSSGDSAMSSSNGKKKKDSETKSDTKPAESAKTETKPSASTDK